MPFEAGPLNPGCYRMQAGTRVVKEIGAVMVLHRFHGFRRNYAFHSPSVCKVARVISYVTVQD